MSIYPDLKLISEIKSFDSYAAVYGQAISQGGSQLINASNKDSDEFHLLKDYTLEKIGEFKERVNQIEAHLVG